MNDSKFTAPETDIPSLIRENIFTKNPVLIMCLGLCPALAVTKTLSAAFAMGIVTSAVMILSTAVIAFIDRFISKPLKTVSYLIITAAFTTAAWLILKAYLPETERVLGIFIPLIAADGTVFTYAAQNSMENRPVKALLTSVFASVGIILAFSAVGLLRELLATGSLFAHADGSDGVKIFGSWYKNIGFFLTNAGAFVVLGLVCAVWQGIRIALEKREAEKAEELKQIDSGTHPTLTRDPVTGRIVPKKAVRKHVEQAEQSPSPDSAPDASSLFPDQKNEDEEKGSDDASADMNSIQTETPDLKPDDFDIALDGEKITLEDDTNTDSESEDVTNE